MTRITLLLLALAAPAAGASEPAAVDPLAAAREALVEKAAAPTRTPQLPRLGIDPLNPLPSTARTTPNRTPGQGPERLRMPGSHGQRARDAADRAAERVVRGDGRGRHGQRGQGGRGERGRDGGRDSPDGRDGRPPDARRDGHHPGDRPPPPP